MPLEMTNLMDAPQLAMGFLMPNYLRQEATVYETRYPTFDYASILPVDTQGNEWEIGVMFASSDYAGRAEWWDGKGNDMPYADIRRDWGMHTHQMAAIGYEWNLQEIQQSAMFGRDLGAEKSQAARRKAEEFLWNVAMTGATEKQMSGIVNHPSVPASTAPADGTGAATTFASKTADQILRDLNNLLLGIVTGTQEAEMADTLLLPFNVLSYITTTPRNANVDTTILQYFLQNNVFTAQSGRQLMVRSLRALVGAGAGGTDRAVAYRRAPDVVRFHLPMPHRFLPPYQKSSTTWEVAGIMRTGGVEVRLPLAIRYLDGV